MSLDNLKAELVAMLEEARLLPPDDCQGCSQCVPYPLQYLDVAEGRIWLCTLCLPNHQHRKAH